ncbi:HmuY family protein [Granulosicoccus antarcticus]|uniref:HmuY protein n=1 Tax=Granulosicoccus antarcticus IMCC3135 TaxID=1192854 RepID=A0A2Z2P888_9GAMM|nr:HmuY family protein [Granulosicoccus antarcticus]ASJ76887.1 hypothetical protein IMCC3135_34235 [Granulosicoccus antarcticus IMCC3135]
MNYKYNRYSLITALTLSLTLLGGCSSDSNDNTDTPAADEGAGAGVGGNVPADEDVSGNDTTDEGGDLPVQSEIRTIDIDATAGGYGTDPDDPANKWTYFNLDTAQVMELSDEEAEHSTQWHMAFKRVGVKVNGGASGPGTSEAAVIDAQLGFYDDQGEPDVTVFTAASAESEISALERAVDSSTLAFSSDSHTAALGSDGLDQSANWWLYDPSVHSVNANTEAWYIVRSSSGESYAKLHVTDIVMAEKQISVEMFVQAQGESTFSAAPVVWTAVIGSDDGSVCYDFDQLMQVACEDSADTWDIQFEVTGGGRSWNAWVNGGDIRGAGIEGAVFGPLTTVAQEEFDTASAVPTWFTDESGGVFEESSWYAYSLEGNNRIWPNYRVYGVDTGETKYKLQILSYYDAAGTSGALTFRYAPMD